MKALFGLASLLLAACGETHECTLVLWRLEEADDAVAAAGRLGIVVTTDMAIRAVAIREQAHTAFVTCFMQHPDYWPSDYAPQSYRQEVRDYRVLVRVGLLP